jgi:hypothetical protein
MFIFVWLWCAYAGTVRLLPAYLCVYRSTILPVFIKLISSLSNKKKLALC